MTDVNIVPASYKDPAGFVFTHKDGKIYRQVNNSYAKSYDLLMSSGLYNELVKKKFLLTHVEINQHLSGLPGHYKTLLPGQLTFISYPYEWCFDMLKDAALLTLQINTIAIEYGMILKDATPYNIQFLDGRPIFIDTLSFEKYNVAEPWVAYRQFCEMFFFPLLLGRYNGENFQQLLQLHIEGIPVKLTASLLPWYSRFNLHALLHVYLNRKITSGKNDKAFVFTKKKMMHLLQGLQQAIKQLTYKPNLNTWGNYYEETILSKKYLENKKQLVKSYLREISFKTVLDIGSNDGYFSLLATEQGANVISIDNDSTSINRLYNQCKTGEQKKLTALLVSIINPSPPIGWANTERTSFLHRAQSDVVLALALIHHLAIQHNIPLSKIAKLLSSIARYVLIEFVPKDDEKVLLLLKNRKDIFHDYSQKSFENEMLLFFTIETRKIIDGSSRTLYLLKNKNFPAGT